MGQRRQVTFDGTFAIRLIGVVRSSRAAAADDGWDAEAASIELDPAFGPEALEGLETFSHAEIVFVFDRVAESAVERGARHPRGNREWPLVDIKPVMAEFLPRSAVRQPAWSTELMAKYWS